MTTPNQSKNSVSSVSASQELKYQVKSSDNLSKIAKNYFNDSSRSTEIFELNKEQLHGNPNKLKVGQELVLPPKDVKDVSVAKLPPKKHEAALSAEPLTKEISPQLQHKQIALTFDDGPNREMTPQILDALKKHNVKATFFVVGRNIAGKEDILKRIVAEGHILGNHTFDHKNLSKLNDKQIADQLELTQKAVDKALGYHYELELVRPPKGAIDRGVKTAISKHGDRLALWSVDSRDWVSKSSQKQIMSNVFEGEFSVARGGMVLFHDIKPQTVQIIDDVLSRLESKGIQIASISDISSKKAVEKV